MRLIQQFGYTVKPGQDEAHQRWMTDNDAAIRAAVPPGTRYIGTFAVVLSTEKQAGSYLQLFELENYAALDASAAAAKDAKGEFGKLMRDSSQFYDLDYAAPWSSSLLKDVLDATIWDPKGS